MKSMSNLFAFSIALLLHLIFRVGSLCIQQDSVKRRSTLLPALLPVRSQLSFPSPNGSLWCSVLGEMFNAYIQADMV